MTQQFVETIKIVNAKSTSSCIPSGKNGKNNL